MVNGILEPGRADELRSILIASDWLLAILEHVAVVDPPQWWVGAGVIRDVVWDARFRHGVRETKIKDVDVAFFDPSDLRPARDEEVQARLRQRDAGAVWDATNQAAVHLWYPKRFGLDVSPFASVPEAVATWPEYAVCVAVRLSAGGRLAVSAPHGLDDLLDGVWRRNPTRVTADEYRWRLARKQPSSFWSGVRVVR
jgi:hypothetical protein